MSVLMAADDAALTPWSEKLAQARLLRVRRWLGAEATQQLYAIVDAAVDEGMYGRLQLEPSTSQALCLYDGDPAVRYARYAPYLVRLHAHSPLFWHWTEYGWKLHWGIWCASALDPGPLKRHFKRYLTLLHEDREAYLRYYDPRVLPSLLASLKPGHLYDFFAGECIGAFGAYQAGTHFWVARAAAKSWTQHAVNAATLQTAVHSFG